MGVVQEQACAWGNWTTVWLDSTIYSTHHFRDLVTHHSLSLISIFTVLIRIVCQVPSSFEPKNCPKPAKLDNDNGKLVCNGEAWHSFARNEENHGEPVNNQLPTIGSDAGRPVADSVRILGTKWCGLSRWTIPEILWPGPAWLTSMLCNHGWAAQLSNYMSEVPSLSKMDSLVKMTDMTDKMDGVYIMQTVTNQMNFHMDWRIWYSNTEPGLSHFNGSRSTGRSRPGLPPEFGLGGLPPLPARRWAADGSQPFDGDVHSASATGEPGRHGLGWLRSKMTNGWVWIFKHAWSILEFLKRSWTLKNLRSLSMFFLRSPGWSTRL